MTAHLFFLIDQTTFRVSYENREEQDENDEMIEDIIWELFKKL